MSDTGYWTFLAITQDGGGTAENVALKGEKLAPGSVHFFDLTDLYPIVAGENTATAKGTAAAARTYTQVRQKTLNLGDLKPEKTVLIALFLAAPTYTKGGRPFDQISISQGFVPTTLTYRDSALGRIVSADVRQPSQSPLFLSSGVEARG